MHHHAKPFVDRLHADRTARRAFPADTTELESLIARAARSDNQAWAVLIARLRPRVQAVANSHRLGSHDAEDLAQTTWLQLLTHIGSVRDPSKLGAYVHTIARHASPRLSPTAGREEPVADVPEPPAAGAQATAEAGVLERERKEALTAALRDLPERQRRLMEMLLCESEPSYEEIAERLAMPVGSIGPTRARSLARLRQHQQLARALS